MAKWAVTWRFKPNPHTTDNCVHHDFIECKRDSVERIYPKLCRYSEYVEILEVVSAKVWDRRLRKERGE